PQAGLCRSPPSARRTACPTFAAHSPARHVHQRYPDQPTGARPFARDLFTGRARHAWRSCGRRDRRTHFAVVRRVRVRLGLRAAFPRAFFPFASQLDGMFYAFAVFALGFIARPLGSMFFLVLQRNFGLATKLTIALFMLGMATAGIAFMPGYATLGWWAILALALLRFGQGFSLGGSWNGLASLAALMAPR